MPIKLTRRSLLLGAGGVGIGLPLLEAMVRPGRARAQDVVVPKRYCVVFAGQSIGGDQWEKNRSQVRGERITEEGNYIVPATTGRDFDLTLPLQPLADLRGDFSLVSNMRIPFSPQPAESPDDVPLGGAFSDFHGGGCSPLISGTRSTAPNFTSNGITSDQRVAQHNAGQTTFGSLVLRAQPEWYLAGSDFAGRQYISYSAAGRANAIEAQTSPQAAFNALFSNFVPQGERQAALAAYRLRTRRSVLDAVLGKRDRLLAQLGQADQRRIEEHFDDLREVERRVAAAPPPTAGECRALGDPGPDPAIGGNNSGQGFNPDGDPNENIQPGSGYSDEHARARLLADIIHMAFTCDLTRAATLQITVFQSHMNVIPITEAMGLPIRADLHEVGHNGDAENRGQVPVSMCLQWHISHYAYLLDKLKRTPEGDGNLLDNSVVLFMPEAGHGQHLNNPSDEGNYTHSVEQMVMLVAGRAGGLAPGQHIDAQREHPARTLVSCMQAAGVETDTLGEVTGNRPELFG